MKQINSEDNKKTRYIKVKPRGFNNNVLINVDDILDIIPQQMVVVFKDGMQMILQEIEDYQLEAIKK